jgi:hypothetical protein
LWKARSLADHDHRNGQRRQLMLCDEHYMEFMTRNQRRLSPLESLFHGGLFDSLFDDMWPKMESGAVAGHASDTRPDTMFQLRPDASGGCGSGSFMRTRKAPGTSAAIFAMRVCSSSRICSAVRTAFGIGLPPSVARPGRD